MDMKAAFQNSTFLCLLLLQLLCISTRVDSESVTLVNTMSHLVFIHCYSKDDTVFHDKALFPGQPLDFSFNQSFLGNTLFVCHATRQFGVLEVCWQAYNQQTVAEYCKFGDHNYDCTWTVGETSVTYEHDGNIVAMADWGSPC